MRRTLTFLISVIATVVLMAATYTPENLPIPYLQDRTQYVSNPDGLLSQTAVDSLNLWLGEMEKTHGVQTVLAVVERIEGGETYDFCMALGRKYGIGRKEQNSGLIILLSTGDRAYTILTGRGLEGTLPDGRRALVIWRTVSDNVLESNAALDAYFTKYRINPADREYDVIFVNGDNNLENLRTTNETWKVQMTETEFKKRMFEEA